MPYVESRASSQILYEIISFIFSELSYSRVEIDIRLNNFMTAITVSSHIFSEVKESINSDQIFLMINLIKCSDTSFYCGV